MNFIPNDILCCDHINRNRLDNRKSNLRVVDRKCNAINRSIRKNNTSGFTGVSKTNNNKWRVSIGHKYIGTFETFEDAVKVRKKFEEEYYKGMKYYDNQDIN